MNCITRRWTTVASVSFLGLSFFSCTRGPQDNKAATPATPASQESSSCLISDAAPASSVQFFGELISDDRYQARSWRKYATMKEVQAAVDAGEISDPPAQLWTQPDGTLRVMMIHGDDHAVLNLDYCFRTDGTLAASVSTHGAVQGIHPDPNIEVGPVARTTRREFDRCGRQVAQQVGPWVGSGGKPAPEGTGVIDREEPPVPHIRSLLFFELIDGSSLPHAALETPRC